MSLRLFATTPKGMEELLAEELRGLGVVEPRPTRAGVAFTGTLATAYRACLWSRLASRILSELATFPAPDADALYAGVQSIDWRRHLAPGATLAVTVTATGAAITHTHFAALRVKDAVVDQLRESTGERPSVDLVAPDVRLNVHLHGTEAVLSLDLSGESLHRRRYRESGVQVEAPLKEQLAAAILLRAGWPAIAADAGPLVDPLCGSGTLLIEGAMLAGDVAPGLLREHFGFQGWRGHDPAAWQGLIEEAHRREREGRTRIPPVVGYDADPAAVHQARQNVARAGLEGIVRVDRADLASLAGPARRRPPTGTEADGAPPARDEQPGRAAATPATAPSTAGPSAAGALGLVVSNPPYGERLGSVPQLRHLYAELGTRMREAFPGWRGAVFTANEELAHELGLRAYKAYTLYNGALRCRLLLFALGPDFAATSGRGRRGPDAAPPDGQPGIEEPAWPEQAARTHAAAIDPGGPAPAASTGGPAAGRRASVPAAPISREPRAEDFVNRLRKNLRSIGGWARREGITCYRLYDADLPDYALAVDRYEDWAHVQEYAPPATVDPRKAARRRRDALTVLPDVLGIPREHVIFKTRTRQRGPSQYQRLAESRSFLEVGEGGLRFLVNLTDYLDTGLFLDHRPTRALLRDLAHGRDVLNLFGYTGTASVYAAAGGAHSTTTVDLSNTYLEWAGRNLELNGFTPARHHLVRADVLDWLDEAARRTAHRPDREPRRQAAGHREATAGPSRFGLIFLDPPTFSTSKAMERTFDVQRDHVPMIRRATDLLTPDGILVFSTNRRRFTLDEVALAPLRTEDVTPQTIPPDFARNPRIHHCWRIVLPPRNPDSAAEPRPSRAASLAGRMGINRHEAIGGEELCPPRARTRAPPVHPSSGLWNG